MDKKIHDQGTSTRELIKRKRAQSRCDVNIGKKGVTEQVLNEIKRRLELEKVVKVRILKSALQVTGMDRRSLAEYVARQLNARLVEVRGRTFILAKYEGERDENIKYENKSKVVRFSEEGG
ncbi:MAG: RNA-binding protein [Thermoprotei archaeon]|nr:MAG: RNA-binding protein [Thermoprotei archaeon]